MPIRNHIILLILITLLSSCQSTDYELPNRMVKSNGSCKCIDGYMGELCQEIDICTHQESNPCAHGNCNNGRCECEGNWSGTLCDTHDLSQYYGFYDVVIDHSKNFNPFNHIKISASNDLLQTVHGRYDKSDGSSYVYLYFNENANPRFIRINFWLSDMVESKIECDSLISNHDGVTKFLGIETTTTWESLRGGPRIKTIEKVANVSVSLTRKQLNFIP